MHPCHHAPSNDQLGVHCFASHSYPILPGVRTSSGTVAGDRSVTNRQQGQLSADQTKLHGFATMPKTLSLHAEAHLNSTKRQCFQLKEDVRCIPHFTLSIHTRPSASKCDGMESDPAKAKVTYSPRLHVAFHHTYATATSSLYSEPFQVSTDAALFSNLSQLYRC